MSFEGRIHHQVLIEQPWQMEKYRTTISDSSVPAQSLMESNYGETQLPQRLGAFATTRRLHDKHSQLFVALPTTLCCHLGLGKC